MTTDANEHPPLPNHADVVIIGGGIIGCSAAYFLAKQGVQVTLCEKGEIAAEQSSRNWGWVRQQGRHPAEMPMIMESLRCWRRLAEEINEDVGFVQAGCVYLARNEKELAQLETWLDTAKAHQLDTRVVSGPELGKLIQGADGRWAGALYTASDGRAEPAKAAPAIARAAERLGVTILTRCAVRGIENTAGKVGAVITERGAVRTSCVVCAAGAWSSLFSGSLGITLPQLKVRGSVLRTSPAPRITNGTASGAPVAIRRREDGGYSVAHGSATEHPITPSTFRFFTLFLQSYRAERKKLRLRLDARFLEELKTPKRWRLDAKTPFERTRVLNPPPNRKILDEARANLGQCFPELANVEIAETWAGMIDVTPDALPVISPIKELEGYYLATGFSGHGFGIGLGAGRAVADMVTGRSSGIDLTPFRLERFFDGTPLDLGGL